MATWGGRRAAPAVTDTGDGGILLFHSSLKSAGWGGFTEHRILEWPGKDLKDFDTTTFLGFFFVCG